MTPGVKGSGVICICRAMLTPLERVQSLPVQGVTRTSSGNVGSGFLYGNSCRGFGKQEMFDCILMDMLVSGHEGMMLNTQRRTCGAFMDDSENCGVLMITDVVEEQMFGVLYTLSGSRF